jgi:hypothetical protein
MKWRPSLLGEAREIMRQMFAPVTQPLIEDGLIGSGDAVLDIAIGSGEPWA